jgi:hypothetical protein
MIVARLSKTSAESHKKFKVQLFDESSRRSKSISFGAKGYEDFTIHKDPQRKQKYLRRHSAREDWQDPFSAGFWAAHLLWNKPTISGSMRDISKNFDIRFIS